MGRDLAGILAGAAAGRPPAPDGTVDVLPAPSPSTAAVVAFAAHHVVAADVDPGWVAAVLPPGDLSAPLGPAFLGALEARLGYGAGSIDVVLAAPAVVATEPLVEVREVDAGADHPRLARAHRYRANVRAWETPAGDGLVLVGQGLAGRWEVAFEVAPASRGRGLGRALAAAARSTLTPGTHLWAQIAPGNAPSLRAALAAGFVPVGAEVLLASP